ncbi:MAG TPA: 50S ribosomal protein L9 [Phycisphaerales bacterium]|nr:50S ribosomal protein L9 [Phycisphaerales bacterium]
MATKNVKLLLTENVDSLGIVGDLVTVRLGYARNYLLPRGLATEPSQERLAALADKRAKAEAELAALNEQRRKTIGKMEGIEITLERACNDLGHLYGSVTQQDVSAALGQAGFMVRPREVRLPFTIKRVDSFDVLVKFASDMEATIKLHVKPDRRIEEEEREEMEFDNEGNLIEKRPARQAPAPAPAAQA